MTQINAYSIQKTTSAHRPAAALRPMPLGLAIIYFGIPALLMTASFYLFRPWLVNHGVPPLQAFLAAHTVPTALLFAAALVAFHRVEGRPLSWSELGRRFRFPRLRRRDILLSVVIFLALMVGYGAMSGVSRYLVAAGLMPLPAAVPAMVDPRVTLTPALLSSIAGEPIQGAWAVAALYLVMLFFNIAGEELWWRGVILPRQELVHGRYTWIVHGLLWTLFHIFKWWDLIGLLPVCLITAYSAQRLKNNWPGTIAHLFFNGLGFVIVLAAIAGLS